MLQGRVKEGILWELPALNKLCHGGEYTSMHGQIVQPDHIVKYLIPMVFSLSLDKSSILGRKHLEQEKCRIFVYLALFVEPAVDISDFEKAIPSFADGNCMMF